MTDQRAADMLFNHLIFVGDKVHSGVIENNFSGDGENIRREMRYDDSELHPKVEWGLSDAYWCCKFFSAKG